MTGNKRILPVILVALFFTIVLAALLAYMVRPVTDSFTYEYGERVSTDLKDYVEGLDFAVNLSSLDLSDVGAYPGIYYAKVYHFPVVFSYRIQVTDTIAPLITGFDSKKVFEVGKTYEARDLVGSIFDRDPKIRLSLREKESDINCSIIGTKILFSSTAETELTLTAADSSGNTASVTFAAIADNAPVVETYEDYYVAKGTEAEFTCGAYDYQDGDVSKSLKVDIPEGYYETTGLYEARFTVSDSNGLTGETYSNVHVYEPETIQDMINTGRLNGHSGNVFGALNPYDAGYVVNDDIEEARRRLIPAIVRISYETSRVSSFGSGSIFSIGDNGIIICTNGHVVDDMKKVDVHFYDGSTVKGIVEEKSDVPDVAFVRVPLAGLSRGLIATLKTVHINLEYFETLSDRPAFEVGMYCTDGKGGEWLTRYGQIERKSGKLDAYFEKYAYAVTEVSVDLTPGVSGSMVFDSHGNYICMASFYWMNGAIKENYGVSLDSILNFYEIVFGHRLEYN
ncbi:MAG: serine protease [Lachnospiraceae bacterium]|nr:serine protease [Lachnospiraceae bacterium]